MLLVESECNPDMGKKGEGFIGGRNQFCERESQWLGVAWSGCIFAGQNT